jgi:uncharacterized protein YigA (DUF484 family)
MNKKNIIKTLNKRIDTLILQAKTNTAEFKRLTRLHYKLSHAL